MIVTLRHYFFDHFQNFPHLLIDMQLNVHSVQVLVQTQLLYNEHPNDKENKLKIEFHLMKNQFHHIKHDIKLVLMFLNKTNLLEKSTLLK
jgi:hypothetical protein